MASRKPGPNPNGPGQAALRTHEAAMALVEAETAARHAKVARLRAARMERDATVAAQPPEPKPAKPARKSRAKVA